MTLAQERVTPFGFRRAPGFFASNEPYVANLRQRVALRLLGGVQYERLMFRRHNGFFPDLRNPQTFNEKIAWRKVRQEIPDAPRIADKLASRELARQRTGEAYLKPVLAVYERAEDIDFGALPDAFAAKGTHGSGFNVLVHDRASADLESVGRLLHGFLAIDDFGRYKNEWWYAKIPPRILIEPLLKDDAYDLPPDYKFYVFRGRVGFVRVDYFKDGVKSQAYCDRDLAPMDVWRRYDTAREVVRPRRFAEMVEAAEALAGDADFLRVDLHCLNNEEVLFGELTLAPSSGWNPYAPSADRLLGSFWQTAPVLR